MDAHGGGDIALGKGIVHGSHLAGDDIGGHGDDAAAADGHEGQSGEVVTGKQAEALGALFHDQAALAHVAGGFFHAHDIGELMSQTAERGRQQVGAGTAGNVVGDQRHVDGFGDGLEVTVQTFLGGLVVIGGDQQRTVGPGFLGKAGQADGFDGIVGTGTGQDGHTPLDLVDTDLDDTFMLFVGERGRFAGGAARHKAVDSLTDLEFNEFAIGGFINGAVFERRDEGGQGTEKLHGPLLGTELNGTAVTG